MITCSLFDNCNGKDIHIYTLENNYLKVGILDFGGILNFIKLKTAEGEKNVIVSYKSISGYLQNDNYCGASVGRVTNRIANGEFSLNGKTYKVSRNDGEHCNHGGKAGFNKRFFTSRTEGESLILSLVSENGDMGFPGELNFEAKFYLEDNCLHVSYSGESDKDTLFSPTCHPYFSLDKDVSDTLLHINAEKFTPVNSQLIPTGIKQEVKGTPYDFTSFKRIGEDINALGGGTYDINYVLNDKFVGEAKSSNSKIALKVYADMPGAQLYVSECKSESEGEGGAGFCLEPQYFPNAINIAEFEAPILQAFSKKCLNIKYVFDF